jgi:hypothetical protein
LRQRARAATVSVVVDPPPHGTGGNQASPTPGNLREGVREGILGALREDLDRTSGATTRSLALAGVLGVATAIGAVVLFSGGTLASVHGWHLAFCAAAWAGILVECFLVVLLRIEGRRLSLGHATTLALVGFLLAAALGVLCPHPHYIEWWAATDAGSVAARYAGDTGGAFCFGLCLSGAIALGASLIANFRSTAPRSVWLSAALLFLLMWPVLILQFSNAALADFAAGTLGLLVGIGLGLGVGVGIDRLGRRAG